MNQGVVKIFKNSVFLYIRMAILMIVSLYVTRVILHVFGTDGYGLYNVVGGVVSIFASMKVLFSTSIQRFLNYYKGKGDVEAMADVFNIGVLVHVILSVVFGICVEITGTYLIYYKLNIPPHLFDSALFVFHCSVVTACITIVTIPYDAVVIANEKMGVYAIISIIDGFFKLCIALALPYIPYDKLSTYALLLCFLSVLLRLICSSYCRRFPECRTKFRIKKGRVKDVLIFSSWNFLGNLGYSLMNEVVNIFLNIFGGVVINGARAIAYQIRSAVQDVSSNFSMAANPRIVQGSTQLSVKEIFPHILELGRITYYITFILTIPLFVFLPQILYLWLGDVPPCTIEITRLIFIYLLFRSFHSSIDTLFKAYGEISKYQVGDLITLLMNIPSAYLILNSGGRIEWVFFFFSVWEVVNLITILCIAKNQLGFDSVKYGINISVLIIKTLLYSLPVFYYGMRSRNYFVENYLAGVCVSIGYILMVVYLTTNKFEKDVVHSIIKNVRGKF